MNKDINEQRQELEDEIKKLGYQTLRYSLLCTQEEKREEWQIRIDYENGKYYVYGLVDRAGLIGEKKEFADFSLASAEFLDRLKHVVRYNQLALENNMLTRYSSPLWDK